MLVLGGEGWICILIIGEEPLLDKHVFRKQLGNFASKRVDLSGYQTQIEARGDIKREGFPSFLAHVYVEQICKEVGIQGAEDLRTTQIFLLLFDF